jgi:hypothetical protein
MVAIGYQVQASDTHMDVELMQFKLWRGLTSGQKLRLIQRAHRKGCQFILMGMRHQFPDLAGVELKRLYVARRWGDVRLNDGNLLDFREELMLEDPIWLIRQLAKVFEDLGIPYYVGGSVASSLQGEVRFTEDLDVAINIQPEQVGLLIEALGQDFYISEVAVNEAIQGLTNSFNVIHLQTVEKADIFISGRDEFEVSKMARRRFYEFEEGEGGFYVSSPEDTVLQKLFWLRLAGGQSQKQWRDVLGILKLQGDRLDLGYLGLWAERLGVREDLRQAMIESGLSGD